MKESSKAQHKADKASFAAAKAESGAQFEEAKAMEGPPPAKQWSRRDAMSRSPTQTPTGRWLKNASHQQRERNKLKDIKWSCLS